jgi:hypothetical protein
MTRSPFYGSPAPPSMQPQLLEGRANAELKRQENGNGERVRIACDCDAGTAARTPPDRHPEGRAFPAPGPWGRLCS